jgi:hypothetical protein
MDNVYNDGAAYHTMNTNHGNRAASVHHIWTATPSVVNEARFNFTRFKILHEYIDPLQLGDPALNGDIGEMSASGITRLGHPIWGGQRRFQNNFNFTNDISFAKGPHNLKAGLAVRRLQSDNGTLNFSFLGSVQFLNIDDFLAGNPSVYQRNIGEPFVRLRATEYNAYIQDDWHVHPRLTLNLGMRYELNTVPFERDGLIPEQFRIPSDHNNWAPRFGFAWRADREGRTVLRGGYGIYYNALPLNFVGDTRFNPPLIQPFTNPNPSFPNLLDGASARTAGRFLPDPGMRQTYSQHWNLTIEREIWSPQATFEIGYLGTLGLKDARATFPNGGLVVSQRPDPTVGLVNTLETSATSNYNALTTSLKWRKSTLLLIGSYTWSKTIDEVSDFSTSSGFIARELIPLDPNNRSNDRGASDLNLPHVFRLAYNWNLPFLRANRILGGWQFQGVVSLQSGRPYSLYTGGLNSAGFFNNRIVDIPGAIVRDSSGRTAFSLAPGTEKAALTPAFGTLGTIGRNTEYADKLVRLDIAVGKTFRLTERVGLQIRGEAFNLLNTVNYLVPDNTLSSPNFGQYLSASDARNMQLAVRFTF